MLKILVAEDEKKHLDDAKEFFASQQDVELITASYGYEAIKIIRKEHASIDGVITDICMPVGLRNDEKHLKILTLVGVGVAMQSALYGIPSIFCSDLNHHSVEVEWLEVLQSQPNDLPILPLFFWGHLVSKKDWGEALLVIRSAIQEKKEYAQKALKNLEKYRQVLLKIATS